MSGIIDQVSMAILLSLVPTVSTGMSTFCNWQLITLQSDCIVEARLESIVESGGGGIVHGQGSLIIESAAFGASAGDTLEFRWDHAGGVSSHSAETSVSHSTGDVPYGRWSNGKAGLWFICEQSDGSYRAPFKGCSTVEIERFGKVIFRQISSPVSLPEKSDIDLERDGWKLEALRSYLAPKAEEASISR